MKTKILPLIVLAAFFSIHSSGYAATSFEVRVTDGNDDAEERTDGSMYRSSSDLELTNDGGYQTVGMRFKNVTVPLNATILAAYIEFNVDETDNEDGTLTIKGEDIDDAPGFSSSDDDISDRTTTTAEVEWVLSDENRWTSTNTKKQTPELKTIVQEIVYRTGWSSGNDMVFRPGSRQNSR